MYIYIYIYIDDLSLDTSSPDRHAAISDMIAATEDLAHNLDVCELPIAKDKSAVLSNSIPLAGLLRRCLRGLGGPPLGSVRALGVDFWAAAPAKRPPMRVRKARVASLAKRRPRIRMLAKVAPRAAAKVYICGVLPSVLFDAPIFGAFGTHLKSVRR